MVLSSPIILYDYPQVAPESEFDFFDGTEIDEMLALRVMTLSDEEKRQMLSLDIRARESSSEPNRSRRSVDEVAWRHSRTETGDERVGVKPQHE